MKRLKEQLDKTIAAKLEVEGDLAREVGRANSSEEKLKKALARVGELEKVLKELERRVKEGEEALERQKRDAAGAGEDALRALREEMEAKMRYVGRLSRSLAFASATSATDHGDDGHDDDACIISMRQWR